jgi:hypothetical protein
MRNVVAGKQTINLPRLTANRISLALKHSIQLDESRTAKNNGILLDCLT